jgi:hypothetical protein
MSRAKNSPPPKPSHQFVFSLPSSRFFIQSFRFEHKYKDTKITLSSLIFCLAYRLTSACLLPLSSSISGLTNCTSTPVSSSPPFESCVEAVQLLPGPSFLWSLPSCELRLIQEPAPMVDRRLEASLDFVLVFSDG